MSGPTTGRRPARFWHVDLDAFFAAVEQRDEPSLRGRPVIVGGTGPRGVVAAASYEARRFGVRSAMPTARARRLCPEGVFLPPRFEAYRRAGAAVMDVLRSVTPLVEPVSIDEAFLDVSGTRLGRGGVGEAAARLRARIAADTGLVASIGVASTKMLAKMASQEAKPDGLLVVPPGREREFLAPRPVDRLWGVGPATRRRLERLGLRTIGAVAGAPLDTLVRALGRAHGAHVWRMARNEDDREVVTERRAKSIGAEETFSRDLLPGPDLGRRVDRLAERVAARLRRAGLVASTLTVKVRDDAFRTATRSGALEPPTDVTAALRARARELLAAAPRERPLRLVGVTASGLTPPRPVQLALGSGGPWERWRSVDRAVDEVRRRFGDAAVLPAATLCRPGGER